MRRNFIEQFSLAIRVAASVALVTSVLVLAGALAAGNRNRLHDAVVLKMLGATRRTLVGAYALEYLLIGLATAVFAILAGSVAAWFVVDTMMNLTFAPEPLVAVATIAIVAGCHHRVRACGDMAIAGAETSAGAARSLGAIGESRYLKGLNRLPASTMSHFS